MPDQPMASISRPWKSHEEKTASGEKSYRHDSLQIRTEQHSVEKYLAEERARGLFCLVHTIQLILCTHYVDPVRTGREGFIPLTTYIIHVPFITHQSMHDRHRVGKGEET